MSLPGVMQHLKVLDDAGLTVSEKRGRVRWRRLNAEALGAAEAWIGERRRLWTARLDALDGICGRHQRRRLDRERGRRDCDETECT